jgi:hypothetical protein
MPSPARIDSGDGLAELIARPDADSPNALTGTVGAVAVRAILEQLACVPA